MRCNVSYDALTVLVQAASAGDVSPDVRDAIDDALSAMRHTRGRFGVSVRG